MTATSQITYHTSCPLPVVRNLSEIGKLRKTAKKGFTKSMQKTGRCSMFVISLRETPQSHVIEDALQRRRQSCERSHCNADRNRRASTHINHQRRLEQEEHDVEIRVRLPVENAVRDGLVVLMAFYC